MTTAMTDNRVPLTFDNDTLGSSNFVVNGTVYVAYNSTTGNADQVYDSATGPELGYVTVTNTANGKTFDYQVSVVANPNSGEYTLRFGTAADGVTVSYAGQDPKSATIKFHHNGKTFTGHNDPVNPCYCAGTHFATARGEVAVEDLRVGDELRTHSGALRPVKWIGRRELNIDSYADPRLVQPVCFAAGAFADNLPSRDLWMSPGHNVFVDGALIPARALVNGATVTQRDVATVTYFHVELDSHDVILAEGLPAETYLDTGNRTAFENGGAFVEAFPDFEPKHELDTCFPIAKTGPVVEATKAALLARAEQFGFVTTALSDLHVVADGVRIDAFMVRGRRMAFHLPAGFKSAALVSRTFVPSHMNPASTDARVLGVAVTRLQLDGGDVNLASMEEGWHDFERGANYVRRWTTGEASLAVGTELVLVETTGAANYWIERKDNVVALRA